MMHALPRLGYEFEDSCPVEIGKQIDGTELGCACLHLLFMIVELQERGVAPAQVRGYLSELDLPMADCSFSSGSENMYPSRIEKQGHSLLTMERT